jgi:hypothetical protein
MESGIRSEQPRRNAPANPAKNCNHPRSGVRCRSDGKSIEKFRPGAGQRDLKILPARGSDCRFESGFIHEWSSASGGGKIVSNGTIAGVIVGVVAAVVIVAYVVIHESSKKRSITGCVTPAENGMSVTDEKDKRYYALSGDTADIKPGDRMTLQGKKIKPKDVGKPLV